MIDFKQGLYNSGGTRMLGETMMRKKPKRLGQIQKLKAWIIAHSDVNGAVDYPTAYYKEFGYDSRDACNAVLSYLARKGFLEHVGRAKVRLPRPLISITTEVEKDALTATEDMPSVVDEAANAANAVETINQTTEEKPKFLYLTPNEFKSFESLYTANSTVDNDDYRVVESTFKHTCQLDADDYEVFLDKMQDYKILVRHGIGKKGRIFTLSVDNLLFYSDHLKIVPEIRERRYALDNAVKNAEQVICKSNSILIEAKDTETNLHISCQKLEQEKKRLEDELALIDQELLENEQKLAAAKKETRKAETQLAETQVTSHLQQLKNQFAALNLLGNMSDAELDEFLKNLTNLPVTINKK